MSDNPYSSPVSSGSVLERPTQRRVLRRIAPLQLGKVLGILYALLSLLVIPVFLFSPRNGFGGGVFVVMLPIFYGIAGFIGGVICAFVYNICAGIVGGIEVDVE